jgi:hypothetical protein
MRVEALVGLANQLLVEALLRRSCLVTGDQQVMSRR